MPPYAPGTEVISPAGQELRRPDRVTAGERIVELAPELAIHRRNHQRRPVQRFRLLAAAGRGHEAALAQ